MNGSLPLEQFQFVILTTTVALSIYLSKTGSEINSSIKKDFKILAGMSTDQITDKKKRTKGKQDNLKKLAIGDQISMFVLVLSSLRVFIWFISNKSSIGKFATNPSWTDIVYTFLLACDWLIALAILGTVVFMIYLHCRQWKEWEESTLCNLDELVKISSSTTSEENTDIVTSAETSTLPHPKSSR